MSANIKGAISILALRSYFDLFVRRLGNGTPQVRPLLLRKIAVLSYRKAGRI